MTNLTGNTIGSVRQASAEVSHTYPVAFNTAGVASAILVDTIHASATNPVVVTVECAVVTAFNAATTNVLTVGTTTAANEWLAAQSIAEGAAGFYPASTLKTYSTLGIDTTSAAGAVTVTGAQVGDIVTGVVGITAGTLGDVSANFESTISVAGQIQQLKVGGGVDYSAKAVLITLSRNPGPARFRLVADTPIYVKYTQTGTAATTGAATVIVREYSENTRAIA